MSTGESDPVSLKSSLLMRFIEVVLIRQGLPALLLCGILYGVWDFGNYIAREAMPAQVREIQAGFREIQEDFSRDLDKVIESSRSVESLQHVDQMIATFEIYREQSGRVDTDIRQLKDEVRSLHSEIESIATSKGAK